MWAFLARRKVFHIWLHCGQWNAKNDSQKSNFLNLGMGGSEGQVLTKKTSFIGVISPIEVKIHSICGRNESLCKREDSGLF